MRRPIAALVILLALCTQLPAGAAAPPAAPAWLTAYALPGGPLGPWAVTAAAGQMWLTLDKPRQLGRFDPASGTLAPVATPPGMVPFLLATDPRGAVWYSEYDFSDKPGKGHLIRVDPASGEQTTFTLPGDDIGPAAMAFDREGGVWFTVFKGDQVGRLDPAKGEVRTWPAPGAREGRAMPLGLALDGTGGVWFAESARDRLVRLDPIRGEARVVPVPAGFWGPADVLIDTEGRVWTGAHGGNRVAGFNPATDAWDRDISLRDPPEAEGPVARPNGLAMAAASGHIWVAEHEANRVARIVPEHQSAVEYLLPASRNWVQWVAVDGDGNAWAPGYARDTLYRLSAAAPVAVVQQLDHQVQLRQGERVRGNLTLANLGTVPVTLTLDIANQLPGITADFDPPTLSLGPGQSAQARYTLNVPGGIAPGQYSLVIGGRTPELLVSRTLHLTVLKAPLGAPILNPLVPIWRWLAGGAAAGAALAGWLFTRRRPGSRGRRRQPGR